MLRYQWSKNKVGDQFTEMFWVPCEGVSVGRGRAWGAPCPPPHFYSTGYVKRNMSMSRMASSSFILYLCSCGTLPVSTIRWSIRKVCHTSILLWDRKVYNGIFKSDQNWVIQCKYSRCQVKSKYIYPKCYCRGEILDNWLRQWQASNVSTIYSPVCFFLPLF